ncbi:MAG: galactose-1-phosphate uridylyltransferase [Actinomycetota bacterium]
MPELRKDELSGRWVLLAPGRAARPGAFSARAADERDAADDCPFCPGNEHETPPEVARTGEGAPDTPGWRVRVVPNLYPFVGGEGAGPGATGAHEVVILSPAHDRSLARLSEEEAIEAVSMLRDRVRHHLGAGRAYVQAAVNHGPAAGASIAHPHAQVIALDFVPPAVVSTLERVNAAGDDLVAGAAAAALGAGLAVVEGPAPAWCPDAASAPYEMRVAHRSTRARFDEATDAEIAVVTRATREAVARLEALLDDPSYNLVVHTAPPGPPGFFHWYVEVRPRVAVLAGFELGTGIYVNVVAPDDAAAQLRAVVVP